MSGLDIVGGVYHEYVMRPSHVELFGSAGRAAACIGPGRSDILLHTMIAEPDVAALEALAENFGFKTSTTLSPATLSFSYVHGLDAPSITPRHLPRPLPHLSIAGDRVLCFGALDFTWQVDAEIAVYDPQNAFRPRAFKDTGSKANRLALVLNESEASIITGVDDPDRMADLLLDLEQAEVVVLKRGPLGTLVATRQHKSTIPPFLTNRIFKLGSGDIFSAMFAWAWMMSGFDPVKAVRIASAATAYYVETRTLIAPPDPISAAAEINVAPVTSTPKPGGNVYLAGPFFSLPELWLVGEARDSLSSFGLTVFSPYHDVGHGKASKVVPADLAAIDKCDLLYAIATGLDSGTLFEIGYARAHGKPVFVFVENETEADLKMLEGSGCKLINDFASSIYQAAWAAIFRT